MYYNFFIELLEKINFRYGCKKWKRSMPLCPTMNTCAHPIFIYWTLTPTAMLFGDGLFGRQLGLDEVMLVSGLMWRDTRNQSFSLYHLRMQPEGCRLPARKRASSRNWTELNWPASFSGTSSLQNCKFCFVSHPVYVILLCLSRLIYIIYINEKHSRNFQII